MTIEKDAAKIKTASKFLSLILRHQPETVGLQLDAGGWVDIDQLIDNSQSGKTKLNRELIEHVVASNDKQRFSISADGQRIRANQGHSIAVDLGLEPQTPPAVLYHGTATRFLESIMSQGLLPQQRQHVHLSKDIETATKVGQRHGKVVILEVNAAVLHEQGRAFYLSANGVWLTDHVPAEQLTIKS